MLPSSGDEVASRCLVFGAISAVAKVPMELVFGSKCLLAAAAGMGGAFGVVEKWCTLGCGVDILVAKGGVTTKYASLNRQAGL